MGKLDNIAKGETALLRADKSLHRRFKEWTVREGVTLQEATNQLLIQHLEREGM